MGLTTAANAVALAIDYLAISLANSAEVQAMLGVSSAADALLYIFPTALDAPADGESYQRDEWNNRIPSIVLAMDEDSGFVIDRDAGGGTDEFHAGGRIRIQFLDSVAELLKQTDGENFAQVDRLALNRMGAIAAELATLSGQAGYFSMQRLEMSLPLRAGEGDVASIDDYVTWFFTLQWSEDQF